MYCVKCGVELGDSEKKCPLCGTAVFHPEISAPQGERPYPEAKRGGSEEVSRSGVLFLLTVFAVLGAVIVLLCDWRINGRLDWSGYAAGGLLLLYIIAVLPLWFKGRNPVIFVPIDFVAAGAYLLYISYETQGGWFLTFALPITAAVGLLVSAVLALMRYVHNGYLFILGGATILTGGLMVLVEFLLNLTFRTEQVFFWSFYPMAAGVILGLMFIIIGLCRPLRESLHKKFFM